MSIRILPEFRKLTLAALVLIGTSSAASAQPIVSQLLGGSGSPVDLGVLVGVVGATFLWASRRRTNG